jgi:hypothetical protein
MLGMKRASDWVHINDSEIEYLYVWRGKFAWKLTLNSTFIVGL